MSKQILDLVAYTKADNTNTIVEINFGVIPNFQAQDINEKTGVRVSRAYRVLTSFAIFHILKGHGPGSGEAERGQKEINDADFVLIPEILRNPDSYHYGGKDGKGKDSVVFVKTIKGFTYHLVMIAVYKRNRDTKEFDVTMYVKTFYVKK